MSVSSPAAAFLGRRITISFIVAGHDWPSDAYRLVVEGTRAYPDIAITLSAAVVSEASVSVRPPKRLRTKRLSKTWSPPPVIYNALSASTNTTTVMA
jgi:hypothetical protein